MPSQGASVVDLDLAMKDCVSRVTRTGHPDASTKQVKLVRKHDYVENNAARAAEQLAVEQAKGARPQNPDKHPAGPGLRGRPRRAEGEKRDADKQREGEHQHHTRRTRNDHPSRHRSKTSPSWRGPPGPAPGWTAETRSRRAARRRPSRRTPTRP